MRFQGRVAFVTGAGAGIGRATSLRLAQEGAAVVCLDVNKAAVEKTAQLIMSDSGSALACQVDVRDRLAIDAARVAGQSHFGQVHYLVNCAGLVTMHGLDDMTEDDWDLVLDVNLKGTFFASQIISKAIAEAGGGAIVNMSTIESEVVAASGSSCQPHYNASKGGVKMLTKALAHELAPKKIRVNAVAPGPVRTNFAGMDMESEHVLEAFRSRMLIPRAAEPEEIAGVIAFLLSDDAGFITGVQLPVDGGWLVH